MFAEHLARGPKTAPPGAVGNQGDLAASWHIVRVNEIAAQLRGDSENAEEVGADPGAADPFGRDAVATRQIVGVAAMEREVSESVLRRAPVEIVRIADRAKGKVRVLSPSLINCSGCG